MMTRVIWLTGLSGAGKSTLARSIRDALQLDGHRGHVLDGDDLRSGLCADLGFSMADRAENVRRVGEVARILADVGVVAIVALISPVLRDRALVRERLEDVGFLEVYVSAPLEVCETRDVKGLYARARQGQLPNFTGVSSRYEPPVVPDVEVRTDKMTLRECTERVLERAGYSRAARRCTGATSAGL
jgi:adenylyl-sulfate kinase